MTSNNGEIMQVPAGFKLVADSPVLNTAIAFRPTDDELLLLQSLRSTFPRGTWAEALRFILNHPEVKQVIGDRIRKAST